MVSPLIELSSPVPSASLRKATLTGTASWWASFGPGIYAALPGYVAGTHVTIRVCSGDRCVVSSVITSCQCLAGTPDARVVDLSRDAFARLADSSRGLVSVTVAEISDGTGMLLVRVMGALLVERTAD